MELLRIGDKVDKLDVFMFGRKVGTLAETSEGLAAFQYASGWLDGGYSISPFSLPLEDRVFVAGWHPLDGLFGVFDDSLPDGWGRLLVDRMMRERGIDSSEVGFLSRLALVGSSGSGALEYRPSVEAPAFRAITDLDEVAAECAVVLAAQKTQDLDALFAMAGSSGGARPKVFYVIDGEEWIVKFPSSIARSQVVWDGDAGSALAALIAVQRLFRNETLRPRSRGRWKRRQGSYDLCCGASGDLASNSRSRL